MSAPREDLLRLVEELPEESLVEELPEEEVPAVLDAVRRRLRTAESRGWPPAWFGAGRGRTDDTAAQAESLLEQGFGRQV